MRLDSGRVYLFGPAGGSYDLAAYLQVEEILQINTENEISPSILGCPAVSSAFCSGLHAWTFPPSVYAKAFRSAPPQLPNIEIRMQYDARGCQRDSATSN